jgi:TonB-linked SusC/RagA family outer membrane protein
MVQITITMSVTNYFRKDFKSRALFCIIILLLSLPTAAQVKNIKGKVKDDMGLTVPGATVLEKGTSNGVTTDFDGNFQMSVSDANTAVLVFSFLGFETQEVPVAGRLEVNIDFASSASVLEEVVVVGYGTTTKKEVTGATAKVEGAALEKLNIPRMDQALQGQVSGVNINTNSGSPGGSSSIRIRGLSTFGDNDPLILVDGIVYDSEGLNSLNPADIESINILKDATASIYGVRAANGVIIIETKKGTINSPTKIEINSYAGIQQTARKLNLLNAEEYAVIKNEIFGSAGEDLPFNNTALGGGTNWQDEVFQTAMMHSHNISITGGSKKNSYSVGGSYFNQDGIIGGDKSNFERYNARLNFVTQLNDKFKLTSIFLYTQEKRKTLPENGIGSVLYNTINASPTKPVQTPNGNYSYLEEVSDVINPIAQMENTYNQAVVNKFVGKEEIAFKINKHFTFTNRFNYNFALVDAKSFSPLTWYGPGKAQNTALNANLDPTLVEIGDSTFIERGASVYEAKTTYVDLSGESFLNYDRTFNKKHQLKGTAGASIFKRTGDQLSGSAFNIPGNSLDFADISANQADGGLLNNTGSFQYEERLLSTFLRLEYGYDHRYLVSVIVRRDGSTKFGPNNKYGTFPAVSGAWIFSDESFFGSNVITFGKMRTSFGIAGNDQIQNFAYRADLNGEGVYVFDDIITQGVAIGRAGNPDLRWETTRQLNIGFDLELWEKWDVTTNFFMKNTQDLLFQPDVSAVLGSYGPGGQPPFINAGDVSNRGIELEIGYTTDRMKDFIVGGQFNTTLLSNKVTKVPDGVEFIPGAEFGVGGNVATRFQEGFAIGYFHGLETDGIFQNQEQIDNAAVVQPDAKPGDLIYVDQNGDGVINFNDDTDKKELGSPIPDFTFGLSLNATYKNFDASANIYSAIGQQIIRNYERLQPYANQQAYVIDRWVGEGTSDIVPRVTSEANRNSEFSDYYVESGNFVRLRNIQVGYTFNSKFVKKIKMRSIRVYASVNNVFTITGYRGFDPEFGSAGGALSAGVDYGFYPQARTFMLGTNFKF